LQAFAGIPFLLAGWLAVAGQAEEQPAKGESTGVIFGRVVDAAGAPVPQANVSLHRYESQGGGRFGRWAAAEQMVVTDNSGGYRIEKLPDGFFMLSVEKAGFARTLCDRNLEGHAQSQLDVIMKLPVTPAIELADETGRPVVGARVREIRQRGVNGEIRFPQMWLKSLKISIPSSDESGLLRLPSFPTGDILKVTIDHPRLVPACIENLAVAADAAAKAVLKSGVILTLQRSAEEPSNRITSAAIDLRREPFNSPSTLNYCEIEFDAEGKAQLAIEPGNYSFLRLQHNDFYLTPTYMPNTPKEFLHIEPGHNDVLKFEVLRRIEARGRVIDAETGRPVPKADLLGEIANRVPTGPRASEKWSFTGWAETDDEGEYTLPVGAGSSRVTFHGNKLIAESESVEFLARADGSTTIPDIKVRPLPKVVGVVQYRDGSPAVRAVVRIRGKYLSGLQPVLTDENGRFELQPEWIPRDAETEKLVFSQHVLAFDPYQSLATHAAIRLDKAQEVVLTLEPQEIDWPLWAHNAELTDWQRGVVSPERAAKDAAVTLRGRPAPELDGIEWINSEKLTLAGLRGKYVLLDFWFTGCGPCHYDFPSLKLVHELFKDRSVVVIGVHNNSSPASAVREHVAKIGLPIPVVVDSRTAGLSPVISRMAFLTAIRTMS
jgi:thiol-disulfide isomerase/thioredoxin/protocatechuate 3,4-dioxygenase beta subunit